MLRLFGDNGKKDWLITIEEAREQYKKKMELAKKYNNLLEMVELKAWKYHSESRHRNNHEPFTFGTYISHMRIYDYIEQIKVGMIDCSDIGGIEYVLQELNKISRGR